MDYSSVTGSYEADINLQETFLISPTYTQLQTPPILPITGHFAF